MFENFQAHVEQQLADIRNAGTYKHERVILTPQGTTVRVADGEPVLNLCANNYLGLAQHPAVAAAAKAALDQWGSLRLRSRSSWVSPFLRMASRYCIHRGIRPGAP